MAKIAVPENSKPTIDAIKKAISDLESPKTKRNRERAVLFGEVYPIIRDQLAAGVSKSAIIKKLTDFGVSISNVMFDDLLEAEARRRGESVPGKDGATSIEPVRFLVC
ncbi:hypothetical protein [Burkholderia thailandensis]|uniref:hypothetical protein n=1 Tax=Burkholderia thailandensis TaxID=57975 RepID=UPI00137747DB|nr:hypothetical protein [Burkholderia thailandensis]MCS6511918.1 hypothetical protein [Burkholderia thailandensis]NBD05262.1 hypothetical protein [Burkholderia thailandensis]NOK54000.1 hypothetical protein [Burkholderia thailandensis]